MKTGCFQTSWHQINVLRALCTYETPVYFKNLRTYSVFSGTNFIQDYAADIILKEQLSNPNLPIHLPFSPRSYLTDLHAFLSLFCLECICTLFKELLVFINIHSKNTVCMEGEKFQTFSEFFVSCTS